MFANEKAKLDEVRCIVKAHFDNNWFDENILKNENPPKFLVITNIEDETGSKMRLGRFLM